MLRFILKFCRKTYIAEKVENFERPCHLLMIIYCTAHQKKVNLISLLKGPAWYWDFDTCYSSIPAPIIRRCSRHYPVVSNKSACLEVVWASFKAKLLQNKVWWSWFFSPPIQWRGTRPVCNTCTPMCRWTQSSLSARVGWLCVSWLLVASTSSIISQVNQ